MSTRQWSGHERTFINRALRLARRVAPPAALVAALAHCGDDERAPLDAAQVHVRWTIDEVALASQCGALDAVDFQVTVFHRGDIVTQSQAPCSAFELTTDPIAPNSEYTARATLVDALDLPKSETVTSSMFELGANQMYEIQINFDTDTQLQPTQM